MILIKNILGRIFALWAALLFIITLLPVALIMWILGIVKDTARITFFIKLSKVWMNIYLFLIGCRLKISGRENFEKGKTYIIVYNHTSFFDILVTTPFIPGPSKTIAKSELAKIPVFGLVYKRGSVLVNRKNKNSRANSFKQMKEVLNSGIHMCIYPEGTRNKTNKPLTEFHSGAFKLAVETQKAVIPALIFNSKKAMPADKTFFYWPTKLEVHYLPPVQVSADDNYEALKNKVYDIMYKYYSQISGTLT